jgi:hypothetical protein
MDRYEVLLVSFSSDLVDRLWCSLVSAPTTEPRSARGCDKSYGNCSQEGGPCPRLKLERTQRKSGDRVHLPDCKLAGLEPSFEGDRELFEIIV